MTLRPPSRDRLTISHWNVNMDEWEDTRGVSESEFDNIAREAGYVKLDAQTIQRLRWFSEGRANDETVSAYEVHNLINPILAAIDQEDTHP